MTRSRLALRAAGQAAPSPPPPAAPSSTAGLGLALFAIGGLALFAWLHQSGVDEAEERRRRYAR